MPQPPDFPDNRSLTTVTAGPHWRAATFAKAVERTSYGPDGYSASQRWELAVAPTEEAIEDAKRWLVDMAPLVQPADVASVRRWLIALALQTAGKGMTAADAELKAAAYVTTLADEPAFCFTAATLKAAARKFQWFPSVAEIIGFLEAETADKRGQLDVAKRLARQQPARRAPERPAARDRRSMEERIADLAAAKRAFGLKEGQSLSKIITAEPPRRDAESAKPLYVWIMPDGSRKLAAERPDGGMSLVEAAAKDAA